MHAYVTITAASAIPVHKGCRKKKKSTVAFYQPAKTFITYIGIEHLVIYPVFRTMNTTRELFLV